MKQKPQEQMMITIPKHIRDSVRIIAAKRNMENPDKVTSASEVVKEILINHFQNK